MSVYPSTLPRAYAPGGTGTRWARVDGNDVLEPVRVLETSLAPTTVPGAGNVTQTTSNTTGVTANARRGRITMAATVAAVTANEFLLTNSFITATSVVFLSVERGTTNGGLASSCSCIAYVRTLGTGTAILRVHNPDPTFATDAAPIVHFYVMDT